MLGRKNWAQEFWDVMYVFYPRKGRSPSKMVEGSGKLQMQAPVLLHNPVLQRSSSHSKEYTFSDPKSNETANIWHIRVVIDISRFSFLVVWCLRENERFFLYIFLYFVAQCLRTLWGSLEIQAKVKERECDGLVVSYNLKVKLNLWNRGIFN